MKIFDTNIWVASYVPTDSTHHAATEILKSHDDIFYLTEGIVAEIITVLKNHKHIASAKLFIRMIHNTDDFQIIHSLDYYQNTIDYFLNSNDTKLSFVDMSLVVLSKKYKIETFDKSLAAEISKY